MPVLWKKTVHDYKLLGMAAVKVVYNKSKTQIIKVSHFPMETLRAEKCDKNGVIKGWYYHPCWAKKKTSENRLNPTCKKLNVSFLFFGDP